ncbi:MAG: peptidoglycan DD-metalloendopeptidase family protein [Rhodospirillales bacterium]
MRMKALAGVAITAFSIGIATATLFDFSAALDKAESFALAPLSLGHPAAAATLKTHNTTVLSPTSVDEATLIEPMTVSVIERSVKLRSGNTLSGVLISAGITSLEAAAVVEAFATAHDPRRIKAGQTLDLQFRPDPESGGETFVGVTYEPSSREVVTVLREGGAFTAGKAEKHLTIVENRVDGLIDDSLYMAGVRNGLPVPVLIDLIRAYSWDVDFQRDIREGDGFTVLYETLQDSDGNVVDYGDIQFARLTLSGAGLPIYRFETNDGIIDYFNDKGQSAKKALMRTPIDGARLSSGYGKRKHPVLGYTKMHKGVDFAAPSGTPIYAAGDGVVEFAGRNGGYGNLIRIRHNSEYKTQYAHLRAFAKGIGAGKRVRQGQVIGYVGTTGRSTGPHLHYEVIKAGSQVNPMKVRMPSGEKLAGKQLERFKEVAQDIAARYAQLAPSTDVAAN